MFRMKVCRVLMVVIAFLMLDSPCMADAVYNYVGNNFTSVNGTAFPPPFATPFSTNDFVSVSLTFSSPLGPLATIDFGGVGLTIGSVTGNVTPTSWLISDGISNWTTGAGYPTSISAHLVTDSSGNIVMWSFGFSNTLIMSGFYTVGTSTAIDAVHTFSGDASVSNNPGTWTEQVTLVPEPTTILLLFTGIAPVFFVRRKR